MKEKVYITGIGVITAIGKNTEENLASLRSEKSGISKIEILETNYRNEFDAGEIKITNSDLSEMLNLKGGPELPRTTLIALSAAREAYNDAKLNGFKDFRTGLIAGTTVGGMEKTEKYYRSLEKTDFIKSHSCGSITEQVASYLEINEYITTFNTACSSGANAILHGAELIRNDILDMVIAGGFDSLTKFTINGFKSLYILSPVPCAPFDKDRSGLNLGEGAGFLVLESEESIRKTGKKVYGTLSGYANTNDAFHQTASSDNGEGAYLSMTEALNSAGLKPSDIHYINVHGTGTDNNDFSEGMALKRVFGKNIPPFSSTKSNIGHTLGAAGGIEAVYSILAINHNLCFANLNFRNPIDELNISPVKSVINDHKITNVMSNSFGFGGNCTSLIFSAI